MHKLLLIALAGGLGSLCRYGLAGAAQRLAATAGYGFFPWGTFCVNALGCLLFGLAAGALENRLHLAPEVRLVLLTGFMGAFTTFSTFAYEGAALVSQGQHLAALMNILGQNLLGLAMVIAGLALGRLI